MLKAYSGWTISLELMGYKEQRKEYYKRPHLEGD
jgi:hypothetical protein